MTTVPVVTGEPSERRKFQLTDLNGNNNKYYLVELWPLGNGQVVFRASYGRVGNQPQIDERVATPAWVERKIREKMRKGYQEVALHRPQVAAVAPPPPSIAIEPSVQQVVDWIYTEAREKIASYLAVGLDAVSQEQIERGRKLLLLALQQYANWEQSQSSGDFQMLSGTVQNFYNAIPTKLPSRITPDTVVKNFCASLDEQEDRLNQLEAAIATLQIEQAQPQVSPYEALGAELSLLPQNSTRFGELVDYIERTLTHGYNVKVRNIFDVCIAAERKAFEQNTRGRDNTQLLFHGTAGQNVRHILRSGLICPRTASNGRMFGHGIYFANRSSKSINYCSVRTRHIPNFLFLADVALGKPYVAKDAMSDLREPPKGHDSVWGKAGHTGAWGGQLQFDEFIIYTNAQQSLRYLVTFER